MSGKQEDVGVEGWPGMGVGLCDGRARNPSFIVSQSSSQLTSVSASLRSLVAMHIFFSCLIGDRGIRHVNHRRAGVLRGEQIWVITMESEKSNIRVQMWTSGSSLTLTENFKLKF